MTHLLTIAGALAPLLAAPAGAQGNECKATVYTRVEGDRVGAAVVLRITPGWYLYHTDLGHPDAIGKPLTVTLGGEGITWGELVLPKPKVKEVKDEFLPEHTVNIHTGKVTGYVLGTLAAGATADDVTVTLDGMTCSDEVGICIGYEEQVESKGGGSDRYWSDWPEALGAVPKPAPAAAPAEGGAVETAPVETPPADTPPMDTPPGAQGPSLRPGLGPPGLGGGGKTESGHVSGTLWLRYDTEAETARAVVELAVDEGFHIYHGPTEADLGHPDAIGNPTVITLEGIDAEWGAPAFPEPERYDQGIDDIWINSHHGTLRVRLEGLLYGEIDPAELVAKVEGQACDDEGCTNFALEIPSSGEGPDEAFAAFDAAPSGGGAAGGASTPLWTFLLQAVFWGVITLLMPCTYPMIPITISFFTKQAIARDGKVLPLSLTYGAGIVLIFILIGVVVGPLIIPFAVHPVTNIVIGALFLFFAFVLFGWVTLQPPQALMKIAGQASRRGGFGGVFLMGATLVVTSFTCTAPFVGTLLGSAAIGAGDTGMLRVVLGMGVFGLTMATPFVILSLVPGKIQQIPQAGEWMNTLKVFLGFVELAASLKFISNADIVWRWGILSREAFLLAWIAIFAGAAFYLVKKALATRGPSGHASKRLIGGGVAMLLLVVYMGWGLPGRRMDSIFTAILPNYSHNGLLEFFGGEAWIDRHVIVKDDYEEALKQAKEQDKLVLVNFTGFT